jgi:toxin ParE1/3/4
VTYRFSIRADAELISLYEESVDRFGARQAETYVAGLTAAFERLARTPAIAREREELVGRARAYRYKSHMIVYREEDDGILVIRLPNARSDWLSEPD